MPIIVPASPSSTTPDLESLVLDGLELNQASPSPNLRLLAFSPPIPEKRLELVEGADSDGALLARVALVSNAQATITVRVYGDSRDDAQTIIGMIVDKLEEAGRNPLGIPLVWTPSGPSTNALTFYVLTGQVTSLPVDRESGYLKFRPHVTFTLHCLPYGDGTPVSYGPVTAAGPLVTLDLADVPGDVPATAELTVTEMSSQSRRTVEWGAEYLHYDPAAAWPLVLDSDSLVTSGFSGTQTTRTGAYDPGAAGNSIITSVVASSYQAICGTGAQPHIGTFRVKARIYSVGTTDAYVRLSWRAGDGVYRANDPVSVMWGDRFGEIDLGLITIPVALTGTQAWDGTVEGYSAQAADTLEVDYLELFPTEAGYGKATATYAYKPGVIAARDDFDSLALSAVLNARVAPAGGTWATSGAATDFAGTGSGDTPPMIFRTSALTTWRYAVLGSVMTNQEVGADLPYRYAGTKGTSSLIARWVDSSNHLRLDLTSPSAGYSQLVLTKVVAGVATALVSSVTFASAPAALRLTVYASGLAIGTETVSGLTIRASDASGGALDDGLGGLADQGSATSSAQHFYESFTISTPPAEPIVLYSGRKLKIRSDATVRESSTGGTYGRPALYRGTRFKVQPAGDQARTTRVAVKASRNDLDSAADDNLTDQIKLEAVVTPRYGAVPR